MKKNLVLIVISMLLSLFSGAQAIYKYEQTQMLSGSVSLTNVREFYSDYNISYSYVKADISDQNVSLDLLKSKDGADKLEYVSTLAETKDNVLSAVNADFFSAEGGGKGFSLGIEIQDGKLLQSPVYPATMATTAYDGQNVIMSYMEFHIMAVSPKTANYHEVRHLNKHTKYYGDILMYTSSFNDGYSPAPGGEVVEVVVENNIVTQFRRGMEPVKIPENGCVLVVSEGVNMFLANNFAVGDEIKFDYYITPAIYDYKTAFGGGSMLVFEGKDVGKIGDYAHTVAGLHPRSAVGVTQDGKTLFLLAVDGRQESSRGMRMSHLAETLISLGCYYAVNLDGGGSTRMVASTLWDEALHTVNSPTENRKVINAVGISLNNKGSDTPHGMEIKADVNSVFVGQKIQLSAAFYNENMRPVSYDKAKLEWSATGGDIDKNGVFCAKKGGYATISAIYGDLYCALELYVVDKISGIQVEPRFSLEEGDTRELEISVFDYHGKNVKANDASAFEIVSDNERVVKVKDGKIYALKDGSANVSVSKDGVTSNISVAVGSMAFDFAEEFEEQNGSLSVYPDDTKGNYEYSAERAQSGDTSLKFSYDFTSHEMQAQEISEDDSLVSFEETQQSDDIARAVYYVLNEDVKLHKSCDRINISFYTEGEFKHRIRAELVDEDGNKHLVDFDGSFDKDRWRLLTAFVDKDLARPLYLSKIYVVYTPGEDKDEGSLYLDDLTFVQSIDNKKEKSTLGSYRLDMHSGKVNSTLRFGTVCDIDTPNIASVFGDNNVYSFVGKGDVGFMLGEKVGHGIKEDKNALYIRLDVSKGGIRATDKKQWQNMADRISGTSCDNVFIFANGSLFGDDQFENEVIYDYLASVDKNVFVITSADYSSYNVVDGVKFFTLDNTPEQTLMSQDKKAANCIEFYFGENGVTFKFFET